MNAFRYYGLFSLPDTDSGTNSNSDSKPDGYIVLHGTCLHYMDWNLDSNPDLDSQSLQYPFYRPQTKFAKVMFSQVSVCPWGLWQTPHGKTPSRQTPWVDTLPLPGRHPPGRRPSTGIQSTSGRYTSYWNAFLLGVISIPGLGVYARQC